MCVPSPLPPFSRRHVLVVDDQLINRIVLTAQARALGFSVLVAQGGDEAVDLFMEHHASVDVVLLDLQMPGGADGWEAALAMRRFEVEGDRRPAAIVACTACPLDQPYHSDLGQQQQQYTTCAEPHTSAPTVREFTLACGADAVVGKPIETAALRCVVDSLLLQRAQWRRQRHGSARGALSPEEMPAAERGAAALALEAAPRPPSHKRPRSEDGSGSSRGDSSEEGDDAGHDGGHSTAGRGPTAADAVPSRAASNLGELWSMGRALGAILAGPSNDPATPAAAPCAAPCIAA